LLIHRIWQAWSDCVLLEAAPKPSRRGAEPKQKRFPCRLAARPVQPNRNSSNLEAAVELFGAVLLMAGVVLGLSGGRMLCGTLSFR
jgi:hypothetical protein